MKFREDRAREWAERLRKLDDTPGMREKFDMQVWVSTNGGSSEETRFRVEHDCVTAACAAGWLPLWFPDEWSYEPEERYDSSVPSVPVFRGRLGRNGVALWLGITDECAWYLCRPRTATASQVADDIDALADRCVAEATPQSDE